MSLDPIASFDCLYLGSRLQNTLAGFTRAELHLFSYLSCLLFLYRRKPIADWGYGFVGTTLGAPYARQVDAAAEELERRAFFIAEGDKLVVAPQVHERVARLTELSTYTARVVCLRAASSVTVAFSVGTVREALTNEPELRRSRALPADRWLLEEPGLDLIYGQFETLRNVIGSQDIDLRVPALTWLTALHQTKPVAERS